MTNFYKDLRPASFRGQSFLTPSDEKSFGRRVYTHEYPGQEEPYHEDMGKSPESITIDAIVHGDGYIASAKAFEVALLQEGPATLIHPHYGSLQVVVLTGRRVHTDAEVGLVRFSFTCEKFGGPKFPSAISDTISALGGSGDDLFASALSDFQKNFNITQKPDWMMSDITGLLDNVSSLVQDGFSRVGLKSLASSLLPESWNVAIGLGEQIVGIFKSFSSSANSRSRPLVGGDRSAIAPPAARVLKGTTAVLQRPFTLKHDSAAVSDKNLSSIDLLVRASALAASAKTARLTNYESKEAAFALRRALSDGIEQLRNDLYLAKWDDSWRATGNVLSAFNRDINDRIGRLPRTITIETAAPRTTLDLVQRLYPHDRANLFARASDLTLRNGIRHPGLLNPRKLEVLINE